MPSTDAPAPDQLLSVVVALREALELGDQEYARDLAANLEHDLAELVRERRQT